MASDAALATLSGGGEASGMALASAAAGAAFSCGSAGVAGAPDSLALRPRPPRRPRRRRFLVARSSSAAPAVYTACATNS
ncbi:MAG: hypothetical protein ACOY99_09610, partial [Pseudomonadota bacterium]